MNARYVLALIVLMSSTLCAQNNPPGPTGPPVIDRPEIKITSLAINESADDFSNQVVRGGEQLYFSSARSGPFSSRGQQRIWMTNRTSDGWSIPATVSEALSHGKQVGSAAFTPDGNSMIF